MFATESQTQTENQPPTLAEIVREVTDNGRTIINFFQDAMDGKLDGFEPCHRIAAARELAKRGDKRAIAFLQSFYPKSNGRRSNGRKPSPAIGESLPDDELAPNDELAEIVREVTGNGRTIVCFLHDVMHGNLDGFKPCHRVACGKELLRRGFDIIPADYDHDEYEDHDDVQQCHDEPFDHKKYAREQFWRDGADGKALAQIYGSEEAVSVALSAVREHRRRTVSADAHIPDLDYTPIENPEDDPYGKGCFGYDTLRLSFNDNQAIRAANKAVEEYKKRKTERPEEETAREGPPVDRPSCCFPKPTSPSSPEEDDTRPPDHWSRKYMEGLRNRSIETDKSSKDPDPPSSVPPERPQKTHVGAGFKPDRGLARPSTEPDQPPENPDPVQSKSHKLSDAKDPPRKRSVKIFVGPPDEDPRQCRDPGDFQGAIDSIRSTGVF